MSDELVEVIHDCTDWCDVYLRSIVLEKAGHKGEQHTHEIDHPTLCGSGAAEFFEDGVKVGEVRPGEVAHIHAGKEHYFVALEDGTRLTCIFGGVSAIVQRSL